MTEIILLNAFCIMVICILILGNFLQKENRDVPMRKFTFLLFAVLVFLLVNLVGEIFEGSNKFQTLSFVDNILAFLTIDFVVLSFNNYLKAILSLNNEKIKKSKLFNVVIISSIVRMAVTIVLALTDNLFAIVDGSYIERELSFIPYIMSSIIMLELITIIIVYHKYLTTRQFVLMLIYEILPVLPIIIEMYTNIYSLTGVSITLSTLMVYVLVQDTTIEKRKMREAVLEELSTKDLLTNLNNRRAFYNRIAELDPEKNIGVIFCDMNGLKYTNDHFGHTAGDNLIKMFSSIISNSLGAENVFRISGDEFVALISDKTEEEFREFTKSFYMEIIKNDFIAALGATFGACGCVERLVSEAETAMYQNKKSIKNKNRASEKFMPRE